MAETQKYISRENAQQILNSIKTTYATKSEVNLKADASELSNYATNENLNLKADKTALDALATKEEVGLKADATALDNKVDKVDGKGLSANDYTTEEKNKLADIAAGAQANVIEGINVNGVASELTNKVANITVPTKVSDLENDSKYLVASDIANKVDKVDGKELSTNDLTDELKAKYDKTVKDVAGLTAVGGQANTIESVSVNGENVTPDTNKNVDIAVPTKVSALENDAKYLIASDIANKVDKVDGKSLSTNDYTTAEKTKLGGIDENAQVNVIETVRVDGTDLEVTGKAVNISLSGKVDKVEGKGLSTNDLTNELLTKLQNAGTSNFSGKYTDLTETPNIANEALAAVASSEYATDLAAIKADYVTSASLASTIAATGHIKFEFADTLPDTGEANIIYFIKDADAEAGNAYAEYVFNAGVWEKVGVKKVDFSSCWTKDELTACTTEDIDALFAA